MAGKLNLEEMGEGYFKSRKMIKDVGFDIYLKRESGETLFYYDDRKKRKEGCGIQLRAKAVKKGNLWITGIKGLEGVKDREEAEKEILKRYFKNIKEGRENFLDLRGIKSSWKKCDGGKEKEYREDGDKGKKWAIQLKVREKEELRGIYDFYINGKLEEKDIDFRNEKRAERIFMYNYVYKYLEK